MKKLISLLLTILLLSVCVTASARVVVARPSMNFDGDTVNCRVTIKGSGDELEATLELRRGTQVLATWSASDTDLLIIDEDYSPVYSGLGYSLRLYGSINGVDFDDITVYGVCP